MMGGKVPLPAAAYCMYEIPDSNVEFWDNALEVVLDRENKSVARDYPKMDIAGKARVMVEVQVLFTQYLDYIGDKVDKNKTNQGTKKIGGDWVNPAHSSNCKSCGKSYDPRLRVPCENFGDALALLCGDCEDLAGSIMQTKSSFQRADFSNARYRVQLEELRGISKQYMAAMSLDAVTVSITLFSPSYVLTLYLLSFFLFPFFLILIPPPQQAGKVADGSKNAPIGAHMNVNFLPTVYVKQCMGVGAHEAHSDLPFRRVTPWASQLPVLIGEGTGMFEPYGFKGSTDPLHVSRQQVYGGVRTLQAFKKPIVHAVGAKSDFFVGSLVGFTNYWFELGAPVGGFWYGSGSLSSFKRGAKFTDLVNAKSSVRILPHPPMTKQIMTHISSVVKQRIPPRALELSQDNSSTLEEKNEFLEQLVERFPLASKNNDDIGVPVYIRDYQLSQPLVDRMIQEITSTGTITGVDYHFERISNDVYGYRVHFFTDNN